MAGNLVLWEAHLLLMWKTQPLKIIEELGGLPYAVLCKPGRERRYRKLASKLGLRLIATEFCKREDSCVIVHAGEAAKYLREQN